MKRAFLVGELIYLRAITEEDLTGRYFEWLNDFEVTRYTESGRFPNTMAAMESYYRSVILNAANVALAIVEKQTDRHIGNVKIGPINWVHRCAEFGILIGEKDCWGKGYGTEATSLMLKYSFQRLNLHKMVLGVHASHSGAIRAYERAGFRVEGQLREALFLDGRYCDKVLMGVTAEQYAALSVAASAQ